MIKRGGGGGSLRVNTYCRPMKCICILKPLPISSYQEKVAKARHANDQRGVDFCKGKHILLTSDLNMYIDTPIDFIAARRRWQPQGIPVI